MTIQDLKDINVELVELSKFWDLLMKTPLPTNHQFLTWRSLHSLERLYVAIAKTSIKNQKMLEDGQDFTLDHKVKLCSEIANRLKDKEEPTQEPKEKENEQQRT